MHQQMPQGPAALAIQAPTHRLASGQRSGGAPQDRATSHATTLSRPTADNKKVGGGAAESRIALRLPRAWF